MSLKDIIVKIVADDQTKTGLDSAARNMKGMESAASSLTSKLAGLVSVGAFTALAKSAMDLGSELHEMSKKYGVSASALSELKFAAEQSGIGLDDLGKAFKFLHKNMASAEDPTGKAAKAFDALGISMDELRNKTTDEVFLRVADAFSELEEDANRSALALAIFGRSGVNILPFFEGGAAGIRKLRDEAKELGATLSDEEAQKLDEYADTLKKIHSGAVAAAGTLTVAMVNGVKTLWDAIEKYGPRIELWYARTFGGEKAATATHEKQKADWFMNLTSDFEGAPAPPKKKAKSLEEKGEDKSADAEKKRVAEIYAEQGKIAHDALAAEMGNTQEYIDFKTKARMQEHEEWKKQNADEEALLAKRTEQEIGMLESLQDAQREEFEITEAIAEYRAEDAYNAAMQYGNAEQALRLLNEGLYEHFRTMDEAREKVSAMGQLYNTVFRGADGLTADFANTAISAFNGMTDAIVDFAMTGKMNFKDFANSVIADLMRIAARQAIVGPIAQGVMGAFGFSMPARAAGGPVIGGVPHMVGERGPEVFVPGSSGAIVPVGGGGGNVTVNVQNQSGQEVKASSARASFDARGWVIDVVLDGLNRNVRGLRSAMGGA